MMNKEPLQANGESAVAPVCLKGELKRTDYHTLCCAANAAGIRLIIYRK